MLLIALFGKIISGLKINISKSECMGIGVSCGRKGDFCGLKWPECPIKCLGVYLTYDYDEFIKMNYREKIRPTGGREGV